MDPSLVSDRISGFATRSALVAEVFPPSTWESATGNAGHGHAESLQAAPDDREPRRCFEQRDPVSPRLRVRAGWRCAASSQAGVARGYSASVSFAAGAWA